MVKLKFGHLIRNEWASDDNPQKVLMVVRRTKRYLHCLSLKGEEVKFPMDNLRAVYVGEVALGLWEEIATNPVMRESEGLPVK